MSKPKAKTSRLAILSLMLALPSLFFFILTGIPAIIIGIVSHFKIKHSNGKLKGRPISIAAIILAPVLMCGFILLWSLDAPPIPNDYTIADLRSAPADCAESYELLKKLTDPNNNLIMQPSYSNAEEGVINNILDAIINEKTAEIFDLVRNNADIIQQVWDNNEKARDIIHQLNEFSEIADLYEPSFTDEPLHIAALIYLSRIYQAYAYLQVEPKDIHKFTIELIEMDSVFRKLSINARLPIIKLCCFVITSNNIPAANTIANNPGTPQESIELLAEHFTPFTNEQMSIKNLALFEYLFMKFIISETSKELTLKATPAFKINSTLRIYRNHCEDLISTVEVTNDAKSKRLKVWSSCYPFDEPTFPKKNEKMCLIYRCYNPAGSLLQKIRNSDTLTSIPEKSLKIKIKNDLFQIVLNKRLGKEVELTARAYSDKYIIDVENKIIFSPGPDGESGTKDDIKLPINPEVLGISN
jgi:hypothetical protein